MLELSQIASHGDALPARAAEPERPLLHVNHGNTASGRRVAGLMFSLAIHLLSLMSFVLSFNTTIVRAAEPSADDIAHVRSGRIIWLPPRGHLAPAARPVSPLSTPQPPAQIGRSTSATREVLTGADAQARLDALGIRLVFLDAGGAEWLDAGRRMGASLRFHVRHKPEEVDYHLARKTSRIMDGVTVEKLRLRVLDPLVDDEVRRAAEEAARLLRVEVGDVTVVVAFPDALAARVLDVIAKRAHQDRRQVDEMAAVELLFSSRGGLSVREVEWRSDEEQQGR